MALSVIMFFSSIFLSQPVSDFMFWTIFLISLGVGLFHFILKNSRKNRLRCPKCKHINYVWKRRPLSKDEINRSEVYLKKVTEEVGFSETETDGYIWSPRENEKSGTSYYSGSSTSRHYEYKNRPHQTIEYREVFSCRGCQSKISRRRMKEYRVDES